MVTRILKGVTYVCLFIVLFCGAAGYFVLGDAEAQPPAVSDDSLSGRVAKLERMLADDVPSETAIRPQDAQKIVDRREADKPMRRRAQLLRQINQSIVFSLKDGVGTVIEFTVRDKLTPVKEDKILQAVLEEYKTMGWSVYYVEGPHPTSPSNAGVYKFTIKNQ